MQRQIAKGGRCGDEECRKCGSTLAPVSAAKKRDNKCSYTEDYIFFDYEARQETGIHVANLVVAYDFPGNRSVFHTNGDFCRWLLSKKHIGFTAIAHYARGYDSHFIMQYCVANAVVPKVLYNGSKLMQLEIPSIRLRVIDSHNFIQAPLSSLLKTFGLTELKKGYFPHLFNTKENENYVGPLPDKKFYCHDRMKTEARSEFDRWHLQKTTENYVFKMQEELLAYCDSDVDILRRSCLIFGEEFLNIANIDPFQYITIPSVCMAVYRSKYLENMTIAIYDMDHKDLYSHESIGWLKSFENPDIIHALNGGEQTVCNAKVDGFDKASRTVYQFQGCFWHGCPRCFAETTINNVKKETMNDLYVKTQHRTAELKKADYKVVEIWGCEWKKSKLYKKFVKNVDIVAPLYPRDAFYGGRTEVFKLKSEAEVFDDKDKTIGHKDACSLYPYCMCYCPYPTGHPKKIFAPATFDSTWFGLIKCKIVAPTSLYIPVLPVKINTGKAEKLIFPLCHACAINLCDTCTHNENDRSFIGTWATIEINEAIARGYKILEIFEVWHFDSSTDLWRNYINDFMKIKLETSPHTYSSNEEYVNAIKLKMGLNLDISRVNVNAGKRAVAKLCLNSLWGKFGQRINKGETKFVTDAAEFYDIMLNDKLRDISIIYISEDILQINYKYVDEFIQNNYNTNIFIAIFTTVHARLQLYKTISKVNRNMLYCDTDSAIYITLNNLDPVPKGELLGEWTDELKPAEFIEKFISTGPKSYH